jgi:hypothetical protein
MQEPFYTRIPPSRPERIISFFEGLFVFAACVWTGGEIATVNQHSWWLGAPIGFAIAIVLLLLLTPDRFEK